MPIHHRANALSALLYRLCHARWWWLAFLLALALASPAALAVPLPLPAIFAVLAVAAMVNLATLWRLRTHASEANDLFLQLCIDLVTLGALLFFSGGATNPLISMLLPLLAVAALALPGPLVAIYALLAVLTYSLLMVFYLPLPLADPARAARLHLAGMWLTFAFSAALMAWLLLRMTAQIRERDMALARAREQALREERVVALGALAAGAAHELGTPLATMSLLAGELEHDTGLSPASREDLDTLRAQIAQCKEILTTLSARAGVDRVERASGMALDDWLKQMRERWLNLRPGASCTMHLQSGTAPRIVAEATLEQALINLLNNAARAARREIVLAANWDEESWIVEVRDDGTGFAPEILANAGRQRLAAHADGSGLGIWLSAAAVERLGGTLSLYNLPEGGAAARLCFPRHE